MAADYCTNRVILKILHSFRINRWHQELSEETKITDTEIQKEYKSLLDKAIGKINVNFWPIRIGNSPIFGTNKCPQAIGVANLENYAILNFLEVDWGSVPKFGGCLN